ncbi:hypothetical protein CHH28_05000 [Bacterioplanes sanyensis]|uniref:Uncharacterized protein n=1 Tax=Bacterioplanes sanyensis TaxID=1249553 RepID=A0A222FG78_9GAMM|nr:S8 family serine peptidase [Bacterioplanes sanyensis]ASP38077.1 hypothetical protein CHH28_05000 [Bacterioplanes sanyensis]
MSATWPATSTIIFLALLLTACGGGGGGGSDRQQPPEPITEPQEPAPQEPEPQEPQEPETPAPQSSSFTLSGSLEPAASLLVDSDVNDIFADFADNNSPQTAQELPNIVTLQGFASAVAANTSPSLSRFARSTDRDDYFRARLQAGQVVQLQVVDAQTSEFFFQTSNDLDLYMIESGSDTPLSSTDTAEYEQLVVPSTGDYFINVYAYDGLSKYVLRLLPPGSAAASSQTVSQDNFVDGEAIVRYRSGNPAARSSSNKASRPQRVLLANNTSVLARNFNAKAQPQNDFERRRQTLIDIKHLRLQGDVAYAEPNYIRQPLRVPDDPGYNWQWHYPAINLPQAWDLALAETASPAPIVAVLDTGVYLAHPDFAGQLVDGYDFISLPSISRDGDGIDSNPDDPGDSATRGQSSWHGTHVAGTVAAANNNGSGVAGVSWGAKVMPMRVLGDGGGTTYDIIQGAFWAAGLSNDSGTVPARRADVINMSLGGGSYSAAEEDAFRRVRDAGVIIVAAAGNEATSLPSYPAAYDGVVSVSAVTFNNALAYYSNFGSSIDVAAPGGDARRDLNRDGNPDGVYSTYVDDQSGSRRPSYMFEQGTSMAAPHVAGVVALMKAAYPELTPAQFDQLLTAGDLTEDLGASGRDNSFGYGLIDASKAVRAALALANGGEAPELPVQLSASPAELQFNQTTSASLSVSNIGGGSPSVTVQDDASWLSLTPSAVDGQGLGRYNAVVNAAGLADGFYNAEVTITPSSGNALTVPVYLVIGSQQVEGELTQHYVLLLDRSGNTTVSSEAVEADGSFRFTNVAPGEYRISAGTDMDVDSFICTPAETCGAYPALGAEQIIEVTDSDISGLNFLVRVVAGGGVDAETQQSQSASTPAEGLQR